jgi:hypothetical protein
MRFDLALGIQKAFGRVYANQQKWTAQKDLGMEAKLNNGYKTCPAH